MRKRKGKNDVVRFFEKEWSSFLESIDDSSKVCILFDDDADGVASASIVFKFLKETYSISPKIFPADWNASTREKTIRRIKNSSCTHLFVLDIPNFTHAEEKSLKGVKVIVVDHHPPLSERPSNYINPRIVKKDVYFPTSCIVYKLIKNNQYSWISSVGVLGDHGVEECKDVILDAKKLFPSFIPTSCIKDEILLDTTPLGRLTRITSNAIVLKGKKGCITAVKAFDSVKSPWAILLGKSKYAKNLLEWNRKVEKEIKKILREVEKSKIEDDRVVVYTFRNRLKIKSIIANILARKNPKKVVLVAQLTGDKVNFSLRRGAGIRVNLNKLVSLLLKPIPNSSGGGHPEAAAGRIKKKYFRMLLDNLFKEIKKENNKSS